MTLPVVVIVILLALAYIALGALTYGAISANGELTEEATTAMAVVWPITLVCWLLILLCIFFSDLGKAMFE